MTEGLMERRQLNPDYTPFNQNLSMYLDKLQQELDTAGPKPLQETQSLEIGPESWVESLSMLAKKQDRCEGNPPNSPLKSKKINEKL